MLFLQAVATRSPEPLPEYKPDNPIICRSPLLRSKSKGKRACSLSFSTEYDLVPEEWGGSTICVPISAKFNQNIDELLEMVTLVADMKELKANPNRRAKGTVIEAKLDKGRGPVATVLVRQ